MNIKERIYYLQQKYEVPYKEQKKTGTTMLEFKWCSPNGKQTFLDEFEAAPEIVI